jgi:hypothetical protein
VAKMRPNRRPPFESGENVESAGRWEDVWMKGAQREALKQQTRERDVLLALFVIDNLASLALVVGHHPLWEMGGVAACAGTQWFSMVRRRLRSPESADGER